MVVIVFTLKPLGLPANKSIWSPLKSPVMVTVKSVTEPEFCGFIVIFLVVLAVKLIGSGMAIPIQSAPPTVIV